MRGSCVGGLGRHVSPGGNVLGPIGLALGPLR